ncbi:DUF86 domain-containing protein [Ectothiorhodospiraceae bacterium WFHF3C12]|nr:DUF86 domain-containing protein [Ectothiorhodospiraceae bacterium WFHF3C12]
MDRDLIRKKLSFIETCVRELRELARPDLIDSDIREARFVEHTLQIAVQAALDTAGHIVSARRLGEPRTNRALFDLLQKDGVIDLDLAEALYAMVGFRNVVVHGYQDVDRVVVRDILENHLDDLLSYAGCIRRHLDKG